MADEAEDVLELETELEADDQQVEGDEGEGSVEDVIEFAEDGAAPAPESNSTIREMRQKLREAQREAAELRKQVKPQDLEIGEKPTLESCGYDEEAYDREVEEWKARKAQAQQALLEVDALLHALPTKVRQAFLLETGHPARGLRSQIHLQPFGLQP